MTHPIKRFLKRAGLRILARKALFLASLGLLLLSSWWLLYGLSALTIKSMSLSWIGLLAVPAIVLVVLIAKLPLYWWRLRDARRVAQHLEVHDPKLQLSLRSCLDFLEGRLDQVDSPLKQAYLAQISAGLGQIKIHQESRIAWGRYAAIALLLNLMLWTTFSDTLSNKFYDPAQSIGQTHLDLREGSITVFEPEYTQIPGRTLPLKPGTFTAFPGAKVRFQIHLPAQVQTLFLADGTQEKAVPLRIDDERNASYSLVLLENISLRFLLTETESSGRTSPYKFQLKTDEVPQLLLRSYTPEGPINVLDPLIVAVEAKDDFGIKELAAVVSWDGGEKRVPIAVPPARRNHFIAKKQWYLSDFEMGDAESFTLYFEGLDNNPINGPGIGHTATLRYELESPEKKYDEFMKLAKELLDSMVNVLGDNLETQLGPKHNNNEMTAAESMGKSISSGLFHSLRLTNNLLSKVRETPNLSRLDQNFLHQFRNGVSSQAIVRNEMGLFFNATGAKRMQTLYRRFKNQHRSEEIKVEELTYELLLQLKMWAIFEMERQNSKLQNDMQDLEELLAEAENMDEQELMEQFNKLMDEVMKDFQKMMSSAAQEMDMTMQEFMNSEAMQESTDQMQEMRDQIMQALKDGDMDKARALMEEMKAQMEAASQSMQETMGEMSPEMQAMMENMRELMGLLREIKEGEEELERDTRSLQSELDEEMGGNSMELDEQTKQEYQQVTQRIHDLLENLYNQLVEYKAEDLSNEVMDQINEVKTMLTDSKLSQQERAVLSREKSNLERILDQLSRDGLDRLQDVTLKNLEKTEKLQEYLDQNELILSLESGQKLELGLLNGERVSDRTANDQILEEARPKETFHEAGKELDKILDALKQMKQTMEEKRRRFMEEEGEQRQMELSQQQADLQKMIDEFNKRTEDSFGGSQLEQKLKDIGRSMKKAQSKLGDSRLEGGIQYEQEALQKIGEMMEQLQQSSRPGSNRPSGMRFGRQTGNQGDPSLEDIYIPESEKKAARDQIKETIREQLEKNLPDAYGKEIRKYYEKLMDQ